MADLTNILGGAWSPPTQTFDTPENQLRDAIIRAGLEPPDYIQIDGALHRVGSERPLLSPPSMVSIR